MKEDYVFFERFIKTAQANGMHMNLQLVGIPSKFSTTLKERFEKFSEKRKIRIRDITHSVPDLPTLKQLINEKEIEYLYIEVPDLRTAKGRTKCKMLHVSGKDDRGIAPQIGREFVCGLLELHDRINWRKCAMNGEDEEKLVNALKANIGKSKVDF